MSEEKKREEVRRGEGPHLCPVGNLTILRPASIHRYLGRYMPQFRDKGTTASRYPPSWCIHPVLSYAPTKVEVEFCLLTSGLPQSHHEPVKGKSQTLWVRSYPLLAKTFMFWSKPERSSGCDLIKAGGQLRFKLMINLETEVKSRPKPRPTRFSGPLPRW